MAAIVCRAPRCRIRGEVLDGRSGGGGGGTRAGCGAVTGGTPRVGAGGAGGVIRGGGFRPGGGGPMRRRVGATARTGMATATRPRTGREGGVAAAPFSGGTRAFPLPFPTAPRLRAMSGRAV